MNAVVSTMIFVAIFYGFGIVICLTAAGLKLGRRGIEFENTKFFLKTVSGQPLLDETKNDPG